MCTGAARVGVNMHPFESEYINLKESGFFTKLGNWYKMEAYIQHYGYKYVATDYS